MKMFLLDLRETFLTFWSTTTVFTAIFSVLVFILGITGPLWLVVKLIQRIF